MKNKNLIISIGIALCIAILFTVGTSLYSPAKEFEKLKESNIAKTGENLTLAVVKSLPKEIDKTVDIIGEVDQDAVIISSNFASTVSFIEDEGKKLHKGQKVIGFINGVATPTPFDATISEIFVDVGQNVSIGEKLFVIVPTSSKKTKMKIDLPISYAQNIKKGMFATIIYNESRIKGVVGNISIYSGSETGSIKTTIEMPKNSIPHNAILEVMIEISKHKAYFVPKASVLLKEGKTAIKILNLRNKAETHIVEIIKEDENGFYVESEKLSGEINVVAVNPIYAQDGVEYKFVVIE